MTVLAQSRLHAAPIAVHADPEPSRWNAYVLRNPAASAYHLYAWRNVIARAFGHETIYLTAESERGIIVGILPLVVFRNRIFGRFVVSMPFLNYGGVLADSEKAEGALLAEAIQSTIRVGGAHLELRHTRQIFARLQPRRHKVGMILQLMSSVEEQWQALDRKLRNQVRKAEKSGLRSVEGGAELLESFYAVFARNMRDLGTPVYGIGWFAAILEAFPDTSRIFAVFSGDQPVAAAFVHWSEEQRDAIGTRATVLEVPWASALREFNPQCANVFLYWQMVRFAIERRFTRFDLGRSTPGEGTFHFKRQWGAEPRELVWEYWTPEGHGPLPDLSPKNPRFERAIAAWQRLPVALTKVLGPRIVGHIP